MAVSETTVAVFLSSRSWVILFAVYVRSSSYIGFLEFFGNCLSLTLFLGTPFSWNSRSPYFSLPTTVFKSFPLRCNSNAKLTAQRLWSHGTLFIQQLQAILNVNVSNENVLLYYESFNIGSDQETFYRQFRFETSLISTADDFCLGYRHTFISRHTLYLYA